MKNTKTQLGKAYYLLRVNKAIAELNLNIKIQ